MLGLLPFPGVLLADDIFYSCNLVVDYILELTAGQKDAPVSRLKVTFLGVAHFSDQVKKFFMRHDLLLLVPFPLPRTDLRTLGGAFVRLPLPPCHRRRRRPACFRNTP